MNYTLPEKFEEFGDARKAGFLRVKQVKENGGKVAGVFCTFTPVEILEAAGFTSVSLCTTSKSRARPGIPYAFNDGDTARQMVFSVRLASATTRLVVSGSSPRSKHSTDA